MKIVKVFAALILMLITVPAFAQDNVTNQVSFNGFGFSFDSSLASHVEVTQYLTAPADVFPPMAPHTQFVIYGDQSPDASLVGIRVFSIADLAGNESMQQQVTQLQSLLADRPDLTALPAGTENPLPFLPVVAAGQTLRARVQVVETPEVTGISYVTAYQEAAEPLLQSNFLYTFQGISADNAYYVSAVFRVNPADFPAEIPADFVYETFLAQLPEYLNQSATELNAAEPAAFSPSLDALDTVISSFAFAG